MSTAFTSSTAATSSPRWPRRTSARPGPIVDFQAPLSHQLVADNKKKKGKFEKLFLEGRPPVALGVTSGGDVFGGTQVVFTDVLGDQQFNMFISSVSQYRTMQFSWINMERRLQWALQAYNTTEFFYGQLDGVFYDPAYNGLIDRDLATATRTMQGGTMFGIYPFNRYRRIEVFGGFTRYQERYEDPNVEFVADEYQQEQYGQSLFNNGNMVPLGAAFVQETTVFREFGPLSGSTMRLAYSVAPKIGNTLTPPDHRRRRPEVLPPRVDRPARPARARLQQLGQQSRLHLLRRQRRTARLRVPAVRRPEGVLHQRRTALPADRRHGDADRRARRRARDAVRRPGRRALRRHAVHDLHQRRAASSGRSSTTT